MSVQDKIRTPAGFSALVLCMCGLVKAQSGDVGSPAPRASRVVGRSGAAAAYAPYDGQAVRQTQATTGDAQTAAHGRRHQTAPCANCRFRSRHLSEQDNIKLLLRVLVVGLEADRLGQEFLELAWWMSVFPGMAICVAVLGFNMFADGVTKMFNPRASATAPKLEG